MVSKLKVFIIIICNIKITSTNMKGNMIGGMLSKITEFPHSAYLVVQCSSKRGEGYFSCGSSIVNEKVLLTAGHCFSGCLANLDAFVVLGHEEKHLGQAADVSYFIKHESYEEGLLSNDIALVLLRCYLTFSYNVKRVALLKQLPEVQEATVAGWGKQDEQSSDDSNSLIWTRQTILPTLTCLFTLNNPDGTFCAESKPGTGYPSNADSGSAMIVDDFIQIGLVSYMNPQISKRTTVYTNISYFYDWIVNNSMILNCFTEMKL